MSTRESVKESIMEKLGELRNDVSHGKVKSAEYHGELKGQLTSIVSRLDNLNGKVADNIK